MYLPGQSTLEMSFTSAQFDADLFAMANGEDFKESKTYTVPVTEYLTSVAGVMTTSQLPIANSVSIPGMSITGDFTGTQNANNATITITNNSQIPDQLYEVTYEVAKSVYVSEISNKKSAIGSLVARWPVYASGDEEDAAGVKGYVGMKIYRCRATAMPGFDTSYKSAATNQVTFGAVDPHQENAYDIFYFDA